MQQAQFQEFYVFAMDKVVFDVNLTETRFHSVNVAIIAPKWEFVENLDRRLNGHAAHEQDVIPDQVKMFNI